MSPLRYSGPDTRLSKVEVTTYPTLVPLWRLTGGSNKVLPELGTFLESNQTSLYHCRSLHPNCTIHTMLPRPARLIHALPRSSSGLVRPSRALHTSARRDAQLPKGDRGISLEAKARVQQHVRSLQSSSGSNASAAVRPQPSPHFQPSPQPLPSSAPRSDNRLDGQGIQDGMDHS